MPTVSYIKTKFGIPETKSFNVKTYALVKKNLKSYMDDCDLCNPEISVYRTRRGCWGEWFEHWCLDRNKKPHIFKQGWM